MKKILSFAQKGFVLNKTKNKILVNKYLESKYLPNELVGKLGIPGGQIGFSEGLDESFIREIKEETGIVVTPSLPFYAWSWTYKKEGATKRIIAIARLAFYKSGKITPPKDEKESKIEKAQWIELKDIKIKQFITDEQPVIKKFLIYSKTNPFILAS